MSAPPHAAYPASILIRAAPPPSRTLRHGVRGGGGHLSLFASDYRLQEGLWIHADVLYLSTPTPHNTALQTAVMHSGLVMQIVLFICGYYSHKVLWILSLQ